MNTYDYFNARPIVTVVKRGNHYHFKSFATADDTTDFVKRNIDPSVDEVLIYRRPENAADTVETRF